MCHVPSPPSLTYVILSYELEIPDFGGAHGLHPGFPWFSSFPWFPCFLLIQYFGDRYDWTTGAPRDGNEWKKYRVVPHVHPSSARLYSGLEKGVFWKRGVFRKVHFLEILENLEILEILENPQTL